MSEYLERRRQRIAYHKFGSRHRKTYGRHVQPSWARRQRASLSLLWVAIWAGIDARSALTAGV